ncbi:MAG: SpoIID/LytB domain-containing protein [Bdellovibrionaceae bacterium]|nr:SpoIID/LytB domain-containing protein [Pseudobdellovibrionaceae bacterium]
MGKQLLIILLLVFSARAHGTDKNVRVLIDENLKSVKLNTRYPVRLEVAEGDVMDLNVGKSQITITQKNEKWQVVVSALGKKNIHNVQAPKIKIYSRLLNWEKKSVDFPLTLLASRQGIMMVGNMAMNRYLSGVVPHEMPQSWPLEALKAQAVASRTYALWKMGNSTYVHYDLKPSVADQVFRLERYGAPGNYHPNVDRALAQTEGAFLLNKKARLVKAYFHSDCGGDTDSADGVWGDENISTASVRDVACAQRKSLWQSAWTVESLKQKIMATYFLPSDLELVDVIVRNQLKSQRVESVDLLFTKGIFKRMRGEDLRRVLGYDKIKSTMFGVQKQGTSFVFAGRGNGHGVGMCQWGARSMAASGKSFKNILAHYYPGVKLSIPKDTAPAVESLDSQSVSAL